MTAYVAIADSEIDPESPITTTLMTKLRDNTIAITEGTSPAPAIARAARTDPGRLIHISTATLSASASAIFTGLGSTYDSYMFVVKSLYAASAGALVCNFSTNNGSTYSSTNYDYHTQTSITTSASYSAVNSGSAAAVTLSGTVLTNSTQLMDGEYIMSGLGRTAYTSISGKYVIGGGLSGGIAFGGRQISETVNAIKFIGSGNLTGEIILYGIDK